MTSIIPETIKAANPKPSENLNIPGYSLKDDLSLTLKRGDKLSIASACFSIYGYQALKEQLNQIDELRFIFTSPAFLKERAPKEKREFYIPRLDRERALYGTEFEVKLRNELTQKAIARECADWIRKKVQFRSNLTGRNITKSFNIVSDENVTYTPIERFTTSDLGVEAGDNLSNIITKHYAPLSDNFLQDFERIWCNPDLVEDVTEQVIDRDISSKWTCRHRSRRSRRAPSRDGP